MPASTILLLESDATAGASSRPILTDAGYTVTLTADPDEAFAEVAEHQLVIIDVGGRPETAGRRLPRDPGRRRRMAAVPVLCVSRDRRRRGADRVPRGRRGRRHRPAVRRPRARGPGRGAAAALPALEGPRADHHRRRRSTLRRARRDRRGLQPEGRRRDDDDRDRTSRSPRRQRRPDRVVLVDLDLQFGERRDASQPRPEADASPTSSATRRRCASRSSCGRTRCATTAACTSWPRRARPRLASWSRPTTSRRSSRRSSRATTLSSSTPARRSTSGR